MSCDRKYHFALCCNITFVQFKVSQNFIILSWFFFLSNLHCSIPLLLLRHLGHKFRDVSGLSTLSFFPFPKRPVTLSYSNLVKEDLAYPSVLPFFSFPSIKLSQKKSRSFFADYFSNLYGTENNKYYFYTLIETHNVILPHCVLTIFI